MCRDEGKREWNEGHTVHVNSGYEEMDRKTERRNEEDNQAES